MVTDPYKVLGVSRDATKEEIKRAYRKKGKECHPDLHPDDPNATAKMAEINEAYDMLTNPEKYKKQEKTSGGYSHNPYGSSQGNPYGNSQGNPYGNSQGNPYGQGGWSSGGFGYYDFEDLFGFGRSTQAPRPTAQPGDSSDIRQAIDFINMGKYEYANQTLNSIISGERNARWYYLSALANQGLGNRMFAEEQIRKAIQMEPNNEIYQRTLRSMSYAGSTYNEAGRGYRRQSADFSSMCSNFCLAYFLCNFCGLGRFYWCC